MRVFCGLLDGGRVSEWEVGVGCDGAMMMLEHLGSRDSKFSM